MQNVKETIQYVLDVFQGLGIDYMVPEDFRQAKHSQNPQSRARVFIQSLNLYHYSNFQVLLTKMERFQKLIFDLILLISTDYKIKLKDYNIEVVDYEILKKFIIQYLIKIDCELLIVHQQKIGFNFNNMRDMLLLVGWLMGISNVFEKYEDTCINQAIKEAEEIKDEIMEHSYNHNIKKKMVLKLESNEEDELLVESYNLLMSAFRKIQNLVKRKDKKIEQFKQKLSIQGIQIGIKDFILMTNPEILKSKAQQMKQISKQVEEMSSRMRNQEIFWEWLESVVESDKKEYQNESDYGYPDEIKDLTFVPGLQQLDMKLHQDNIEQIQSFYSEMSESIAEFNKFWSLTQKNMNKIYNQEVIAELQQNSHLIIEELDEKLPSVNQFIKDFDITQQQQYYEGDQQQQDILVNFMLDHLNYNQDNHNNVATKPKNNVTAEDAKAILKTIQSKQNSQQEKLKAHINHIFDSISNIVTAYPNYQ